MPRESVFTMKLETELRDAFLAEAEQDRTAIMACIAADDIPAAIRLDQLSAQRRRDCATIRTSDVLERFRERASSSRTAITA